MKKTILTAAAIGVGATGAQAGGVERSSQSLGFLFEKGDYVELNFSSVNPSVSGATSTTTGPLPAGSSSGDMAPSYMTLGMAYKNQLNDKFALGFTVDQPIGADVAYPLALYPFAGATAEIDSTGYTLFGKYSAGNNISVIGGIRAEQASGRVNDLPNGMGGTYSMSTNTDLAYGYVLGLAWEKPEIAARVALSYNSAIDHTFDVLENGGPSLPFTTTVPQSLNLEFQTGVAADTLVFGNIKWREWSELDITPVGFQMATGSSLVDLDDDTVTINLGVGRRLNENWSVAVLAGGEKENGGFSGNLSPTDGYASIGLAATYTQDNMKITGGIQYIDVGSANTITSGTAGPGGGPSFARFEDNSAIGVGVRIGYSF